MKLRLLLLLLVLVLLAGAAVVVVLTSTNAPTSRDRYDVKRFFALLRTSPETPQSATDRTNVNNIRVVDPHAQPTKTQLVSRQSGLWVVSTEDLLCISQRRGAACEPPEVAARRGVLLGTFQPPSKRHLKPNAFQLQGLVPDNVNNVLLIVGKRRLVADVRRNIFSVEQDKPVHLLRLLPN